MVDLFVECLPPSQSAMDENLNNFAENRLNDQHSAADRKWTAPNPDRYLIVVEDVEDEDSQAEIAQDRVHLLTGHEVVDSVPEKVCKECKNHSNVVYQQ
mmetsp:Transcript_9642/g.19883  ORF Transcript_9642/g.19883 Transcript_9642/m.19883 type:complete len:99 (+) Transcript_9642:899-1195(+)